MGWPIDEIYTHFEGGGYKVWEFLPADGRVWLEKVNPPVSKHAVVRGIYG